MAEIKKLTIDELKKVIGGVNNRETGMKCPSCDAFIPINMEQIIKSRSLVCPHCGLYLTIDKIKSR